MSLLRRIRVPVLTGLPWVLLGCEPTTGIEVLGTKDGVRFAFRNCSDGKPLGITSVKVAEEKPRGPKDNDEAHVTCALLPPADAAKPFTEWTFGARPDGYQLPVCQPLRVGPIYNVVALRPYGTRRFRLEEGGRVVALSPPCSD
jgi:hypothetical protein